MCRRYMYMYVSRSRSISMYHVLCTHVRVRSTQYGCSMQVISIWYNILSTDISIYKVPAVLICTCRYKAKVHKTFHTPSPPYYLYLYLYLCMKYCDDIYKVPYQYQYRPLGANQPIPTTLLEAQTRTPVCRFRPGWAGVGWGLGGCSRVHVHVHAESRTDICCTDGALGMTNWWIERNRWVGAWLSLNFLFAWLGFVVCCTCGDLWR